MLNINTDFDLSSWQDRQSNQALISLWTSRILVDLKGLKKKSRYNNTLDCDEIFDLLDLTLIDNDENIAERFEAEVNQDIDDNKDDNYKLFLNDRSSKSLLSVALKRFLQEIKKKLEVYQPIASEILLDNIRALSQLIKLNPTEQSLIAFFIIVKNNETFTECVDSLGDLNKQTAINHLSIILGSPVNKISQALSAQGLLQRSGLLKCENRRGPITNLSNKIEPLDSMTDILMEKNADIIKAMHSYFVQSEAGELSLSDFSYMETDSYNICHYLKNRNSHSKGVNILIYGEPGVGKTMWVKAINEALGLSLFEVTTKDDEGEELAPSRRMDSYCLSQEILKEKAADTAILFDECEDAWPVKGMNVMGMFMGIESHSGSGVGKGWMNKMLENNSVPTFWIANKIQQIDPAYLRRIDYVIEVPNPPRAIRQDIMRHYFQGISDISNDLIKQVADHKQLTPAHIATIAKVVKTIDIQKSHSDTQQNNDQLVRHLLNNILDAQGQTQLIKSNSSFETPYNLDFLNTDIDIKNLVQGVQKSQQGRFCLWGQPGVGKTAFAKHLSLVLDKEVIIKRASDLLDPYIGMTEKNIAQAFKEAKRSGAILQIDEADSFLSDRKRAHRSWEISQVNELLTQIENFEGIFIASSNLIGNFDEASIRRFDLKIHFDFLKAEQTWAMFQKILAEQGIFLDNDQEIDLWQKIKPMQFATPGDFSTCLRRIGIMGDTLSAEKLLASLSAELQFKQQHKSTRIKLQTIVQ